MTDKTITVRLKLDLDDLAAQFRAAADALTADRYAANEARQREEAEPDPLDEDDHGDRLDTLGDPWFRNPGGCWRTAKRDCLGCEWTLAHLSEWYGPLTFAPDASPAPQDAAQDAAEGADDAVEGGGAAGPPGTLLCPECGHSIDWHELGETSPDGCVEASCPCPLWPSQIARHLIAQATS